MDPEAAAEPVAVPVPVTSRKQNWARFSCGGRDDDDDERWPLPPKASPDAADAGEPDPTTGSLRPGVEPPGEEDGEPAEEAEAANGSGELGGPGRSAGHGAYLQSLERSSRHWVLSAAKGPGPDELGGGANGDTGAAGGSEGEIWYNPIPEDEDPQPGSTRSRGSREAERGRGAESPPKAGREAPPRGGSGTPESPGPRSGAAPALPAAPRGEEAAGGRSQASGEERLQLGKSGDSGGPRDPTALILLSPPPESVPCSPWSCLPPQHPAVLVLLCHP